MPMDIEIVEESKHEDEEEENKKSNERIEPAYYDDQRRSMSMLNPYEQADLNAYIME